MKKIAVVNDLSGFGKCSLTVALPIISSLGIECCPVPTAVLSNQTGYDDFYCVDFTSHLPSYIDVWKKQNASFDSILTGYLASEEQVDIILDFIDSFKKDALIFVDPIMADDGIIYHTYNEALCRKVKELVKKANIIVPNLTELCILCNENYNEVVENLNVEKVARMCRKLISSTLTTVIVTGVKINSEILNIIVTGSQTDVAKSVLLNGSFSGTGDIFASIVCGEVTNGKSVKYAVELATKFIYESIKSTPSGNGYEPNGVNFQTHLEVLTNEQKTYS